MRKHLLIAAVMSATVFVAGCNEKTAVQEEKAVELDSMDKKISYLFAFGSSSQMKNLGVTFDESVIRAALADVAAGKESRLSKEETQAVSRAFQTMQREASMRVVKDRNIKAGEEFLAENGKKEGVVTTASGLQYEVVKAGDPSGEMPTTADSVLAHYHGTLLNGTVFDSSVDRGEPIEFPVTGVIAGWTEVLQLMHVGDKWKVYIPYNLAYPDGVRGIEAGSTLIFDIELIKVIKKPEVKADAAAVKKPAAKADSAKKSTEAAK